MHSAARVLIVGQSDPQDDVISEALAANGYESYCGDIAHSAEELVGNRHPDVVILNMDSSEARQNPQPFFAMARALKEGTLSSRMRVLLVGGDQKLTNSEVAGDIDDLLIGPVKSSQICHRLRALVRLNTMHEELVRRLNTSSKYGVDAPTPVSPPNSINNVSVLFLGDTMGFGAIENALSKRATVIGALTFQTALDYLARENFDSVLIDCGDNPAPLLDFTSDLRRNSRYFNLPVLMLVDTAHMKDLNEAYHAGITDVLLKPVREDELLVRTLALVREQRFRTALRHIYTAAKHFATNDALTGLYCRGFLLEHLNQMIADAEQSAQGFSIAGFEIRNLPEINVKLGYASGDRLIRQVGELFGLLVRGEDLAARYCGNKFAILLPNTPSEQAFNAVRRITGVIHNTEFVIPHHYAPISLTLRTGIADFTSGDTPETLIEKAFPR